MINFFHINTFRVAFIQKRWQDNDCQKPVSPGASGSQKYSKEHVSRNVEVAKEYVPFIVGKKHRNIERLETKSGTTIKVPSVQKAEDQDDDKVTFRIFGSPENCDRAELLIRSQIIVSKDKKLRDELGGDTHFTCFAYKNKKERFHLKRDEDPPKLDGFLTGKRYRIETDDDETDDDESDDDETDDEAGTEPQGEVSKKTISEIKEHLLTPLEKFRKIKDEKQLMADLWCHFGKALVSNVDEVDTEKIFEPMGIEERIRKIINRTTLNNSEKNDYWKVSFEEGIDPSDVDEDRLPKAKEIVEDNSFPNFRLVHTQWRYDYAFVTPSERNVRLKLWEGLPSDGDNEPPVEVKYILRPVFVQDEDSIKAWICYPSTSVLRGEIITPDSKYDCRMKIRAGSRHVIDEDSICVKEDEWLANYLSNCKFDKENHHIDLPEKNDQEDQGFKCIFYREAKERMFEVFADEECFTVIVLDQKGWDSDAKGKRPQKQFGVRVVMNSWSDKLLSPEQHWTPEEILETKLETYLKFVSVLKDYLFG